MNKKALILAAGVGSRMGELTDMSPKCLINVGGANSLDYILNCLSRRLISETIIITGHFGDAIEKFVRPKDYGMKITTVYNRYYNFHGCEYSMALSAKSLVDADSVLIVEADLLMPYENFRLITDHPSDSCVLVRKNAPIDPARSVVACGAEGFIREFAYDEAHIDAFKFVRPGFDVAGESLQVWKFGGAALKYLIEMFDDYMYNVIGNNCLTPDKRNGLFSINRAAARYPLTPVFIDDDRWINLNTIDDIAKGNSCEWIKKY